MSQFWGHLLLLRILSKLIGESAIDQVVNADIGSHTSREELLVAHQNKAVDIVRLSSKDRGEDPFLRVFVLFKLNDGDS